MNATIEWAQLTPQLRVMATEERALIVRADVQQDAPTLRFASDDDHERATRWLLDGAIRAAFSAAREELVPAITPVRWAWRLVGLYHLTHSTPRLLEEAAARFEASGRGALAEWARERAREETFHDRLALRDLAAMGYDAERVVASVTPPIAARLVEIFTRYAIAPDPIRCVGYAYALERLATTVRAEDVKRIEAILPDGMRATRCLRVHSAIGSDGDHVAETVRVVARCSGSERREVATAVHETARLCFAPPPGGHPTDDEIAALLTR
ncbi:hypothetical protein [Sandaracinus amylolyticus]|uniref:hypothetical protein n=1 Tax=Sandaracinus amylolyticus TaxID=927083 RepID=UPI001F1C00CD|nr:hypothetical protein [Sandaracinus amylolyticus]UJR79442.1 Thiaminase [Sandaracinus amylolyticus]